MSRTARTTPRRLRVRGDWSESVSLRDLRYPSAELAGAARDGRRPVPTRTLRRITSWSLIRLDCRTDSFAVDTATAERRARLRLRLDAERIRGLHRAGHDLADTDIPPVRHRHNILWQA